MIVETEYQGPVVISRLEFAGRPVCVVRPGEPDRLLDDPLVRDWNQRDDYMPYWAYLWPGALLLAEVVAREPWPTGKGGTQPLQVLEIGCGVGLAGLVALSRGMHVCFSDYDQAPLRFVERSARENGFDRSRFSTRLLDWREPPDETYPVILGSDVLYERRLVPLVAELLARMLAPGGLGLVSCPGRSSAAGFADALASRGLTCRTQAVEARSEDAQWINGQLYRVRNEGRGTVASLTGSASGERIWRVTDANDGETP
ncbi:MAG: class I SAM-dependent methyltransferase [Isosphaeraceae bacterium]